jgi:hypothetical protein
VSVTQPPPRKTADLSIKPRDSFVSWDGEGVLVITDRPIKYRRSGLDLGSPNWYAVLSIGSEIDGVDFK